MTPTPTPSLSLNQTPDPAFLSSLEWQLATELRRPAPERFRLARRGAFVLGAVSAVVGAACMAAAVHVRETRDNADVVARLEVREAAARRASALADDLRDKQAARRDAGLVSAAEFRRTQARAAQVAFQAEIARLDLEEARLARRAPRMDLAAPAVGGRDFVAERLDAEVKLYEVVFAYAVADAKDAKARIDAGIDPPSQQAQVEFAYKVANDAGVALRERQAFRVQFTSGGVSAAEIEARDLMLGLRARQAQAQSAFDAAKAKAQHLELLHKSGQVSGAELSEAQMEMSAAEAELQMVNAEVAAASGR